MGSRAKDEDQREEWRPLYAGGFAGFNSLFSNNGAKR